MFYEKLMDKIKIEKYDKKKKSKNNVFPPEIFMGY